MMPQQCVDSYISQLLSKYQYPDRTKRDIMTSLQSYKNMTPKLETFVFNNGQRKELLCLDGTIPVRYKGVFYHIPICLWLLDTHPYNSPMCYVKPTANMVIKVSRHVDNTGRIYLPYLHDWDPNKSDLMGLFQVMIIVFGETPPVYSKPKTQETQAYAVPYPSQPSVYNPPTTAASQAYPPYPPNMPVANVPYSSSYPYPSAGGYPPTGATYEYPNASGAYYPPYPQTNPYSMPPTSYTTTTTTPSLTSTASPGLTNMGTISEEHIKASLLSAVEDKLKKRLKEMMSQAQAEMEVLKKTQDDLTSGKMQLEDMILRLEREQVQLESNVQILHEKNDEMKNLLAKMENQEAVDIDEAVITTAPLYKQLLHTFAEESATEDAIYYLGEALRKGVIDLDVFLKNVRELSRKQFTLRALMQKCRQKAGLPY